MTTFGADQARPAPTFTFVAVTGAASFAKAYLRPFAPVRICMDASAVFHAPPSST